MTESEGIKLLRDGQRLYGIALREILSGKPKSTAEEKVREAQAILRSAMNWLERSTNTRNEFDIAHQFLDKAGALARETFPHGCHLAYHDDSYHQECPVSLAHNRIGLSVGVIVRSSHCSICKLDLDDCDHIVGHSYGDVDCIEIITDAELMETSIVHLPNFADARITSVGVGFKELKDQLGSGLKKGMQISCDQCIKPCAGLSYPFGGH